MTHLKLVADLVAAAITNGDRYPQFLLHKQCAPFATGTSYRPGGARRYAPPPMAVQLAADLRPLC